MAELRRVAVYRELLLAGSETFIRNQVDAMTRWQATLVGLDREESPLTRAQDVLLMPGASRTARRIFKISRHSELIRKGLAALEPDVIHAHFGMDAAVLLPTVQAIGRPLVVSFHGVDVNVMPHARGAMARLYQHRLPQVFDQARALIANSEFIKARLLSLGAPQEKLHVLPVGIPMHDAPQPVAHRSGVTFVGRLTQVKGAADALLAYSMLPEDLRSIHPLRIVGDGSLRNELQVTAQDLGLDVDFLGAVAPARVGNLLGASAVMIGPSRRAPDGAEEAIGLVFLEAGRAKLPVVSYRSGGIPEAVLDGVTGYLAEEGNVSELAARLESLLRDDTRRQRMGERGRSFVEAEYNIERRTADLEDLYDQVV